jgi:tetratricopeptide (TPR) repeat protein
LYAILLFIVRKLRNLSKLPVGALADWRDFWRESRHRAIAEGTLPKKLLVLPLRFASLLCVLPLAAAAQGQLSLAAPDAKLGNVHFETSCFPSAQNVFEHGVALLHSFEFGPAIVEFREALVTDPGCGIADWGIALSSWGNPFAPGLKPQASLYQGRAAITAAEAVPETQREHDYIAAAARLYDRFETTSQQSRLDAYCDAMSKVATRYPTDSEASIFYALSLAMSANPTDKTYSKQLKAGAILERLFRKEPRHPGIAHYIIHSYDYPALAPRALAAARAFAEIAPDSPHALHMPSHIFTRLGLWDESIESNIASSTASRKEGNFTEELHASDYLVYTYLQSGRDAAAARVLQNLPEIAARLNPDVVPIGAAPIPAAYFAIAAIPARYALERGDWVAASRLDVRSTSYPYTEAITWFARGTGAARLGRIAAARNAARQLAAIQQRLTGADEPYWAMQVQIQRVDVLAWTALAHKNSSRALVLMREAVALEDATEKSVITPGPIAPASELLGEMLLRLNRPRDAEQQFEASLRTEPNRFRSLYGAAKAAQLAGNSQSARRYAAQLLRVCAHADRPIRHELVEARLIANPEIPTARLPSA